MVTQGTVKKWGNSFGIRVRKVVAEQLNIRAGSCVKIEVADGKMIVTPVEPKYSLDELVSRINAENIHGETDLGSPVGSEIW